MKHYYVYIRSSRSGVLYVGITNDIGRCVREHKEKRIPGFTAKYNVDRLVWFETFTDVNQAIGTETRIKSWRRAKKIALIEESNPKWIDLAESSLPDAHPVGLPRPS